jgi:hypothetical protein
MLSGAFLYKHGHARQCVKWFSPVFLLVKLNNTLLDVSTGLWRIFALWLSNYLKEGS